LVLGEEREIDVFASVKQIMKSEDGFQVTANKSFGEFVADDYDVLILPGILNPIPALFDAENINFLSKLRNQKLLIASISSSPILLAKAGLLDNRRFTCGLFDEVIQFLDFIPSENVTHTLICRDENLVTAVGLAFREFAIEVLRAIGIESSDDFFLGGMKNYTKDELTFKMGEENFKEFLREYEEFAKNEHK
jgi:4-methyl-5(b-hydroxyethyl)-thiazole monophosphate biosynthesis